MDQSIETTERAEQPQYRAVPRHHLRSGSAAFMVIVLLVLWRLLPIGKNQVVPPLTSDTSSKAQPVRVSTQSVTLTTSPVFLEVTGTVQSELEAPLASKVMGRVKSVLAKEGDRVRQGQPLILLDARDLEVSLSQANANLRAADVGYENARVVARMEASLSSARIAEAESKVTQSEAALQATMAKLELVQSGQRRQEREQAVLAVSLAKSNLRLAESNLKRMTNLYREGAISSQQYDQYQSQFEVAKSQLETALQGKSIADEGSRAEDIRAAQQAVRQAQATVLEAKAGLKSAHASAMQTEVRKQEIRGAQAQIGQSKAGLQLAKVVRAYAEIAAPFDGVITKRLADPGVMATPGSPLLKIQGGTLRLEAVLPESALVFAKRGASVPIHFDALQNHDLVGRVVEIGTQGDANSHTFLVKIVLPPTNGASAGMFGRARFTTGSEKRLLVPDSAVFEREGLHYSYVVDVNHQARLRRITVGDPVGDRILVLSGLNSGEHIVTTGKEQLTDGSPVNEELR